MTKDLDSVRTTHAIINGDMVIPKNTRGTVVHRHKDQKTLEVEFFGEYQSVLTLTYGKDVVVNHIKTNDRTTESKEALESRLWKVLDIRNVPDAVKAQVKKVLPTLDLVLINNLTDSYRVIYLDQKAESDPDNKMAYSLIKRVFGEWSGRPIVIHGS